MPRHQRNSNHCDSHRYCNIAIATGMFYNEVSDTTEQKPELLLDRRMKKIALRSRLEVLEFKILKFCSIS